MVYWWRKVSIDNQDSNVDQTARFITMFIVAEVQSTNDYKTEVKNEMIAHSNFKSPDRSVNERTQISRFSIENQNVWLVNISLTYPISSETTIIEAGKAEDGQNNPLTQTKKAYNNCWD